MENSQVPAANGGKFSYHGAVAELYGLFLVNLLLTLVTLGMYHFWAKSRMRRYLWSHISFAGEYFEYSGVGRELMFGYFKAMAVLIPMGIFLNLAPELVNGYPGLVWAYSLFSFLIYLGLTVLGGFAKYASRRYRLNRTRWRNIRFGLTGSAMKFGFQTLGYGVLTLLTAGIYWPFMRHHLMASFLNSLWFGSERVSYHGQPRPLFRAYCLRWLATWLAIIAIPVGAFLISLAGMREVAVISAGLAVALLIPCLAAIWVSYKAVELRHFIRHVRLGGLGGMTFESGYTNRAYTWNYLSNLILLVITLGFAYPFVVTRTLRFLSDHVSVNGALDYAAIEQSQQALLRSGEGLAEALDIGDFGM